MIGIHDISNLKVNELKAELSKRSADIKGIKSVLQQRLTALLKLEEAEKAESLQLKNACKNSQDTDKECVSSNSEKVEVTDETGSAKNSQDITSSQKPQSSQDKTSNKADISATILETTSNLNDQPDNGGVHDGIDAVCSTDGVQSCDKNEEDEVVVEENQLEQDQYDEEVEKEEEYYIEDEERSSQGCEQMFTIEDEVDCEDTNPENDADQVEEVFAENVCFKDNQQQQQQKEEKVKSQEDLNELHTSDVVEIEDDLLDTLDFDLESSECCSKDIKALPREEDEALPNDNVLHLDVNSTIGDDRSRMSESTEQNDTENFKNLWVTGLSANTRASQLKAVFSEFGKVVGAKIVTNSRSTTSKCFGFVAMQTVQQADACVKNLHKSILNEAEITVEKTKKDPSSKKTYSERSSHPNSSEKVFRSQVADPYNRDSSRKLYDGSERRPSSIDRHSNRYRARNSNKQEDSARSRDTYRSSDQERKRHRNSAGESCTLPRKVVIDNDDRGEVSLRVNLSSRHEEGAGSHRVSSRAISPNHPRHKPMTSHHRSGLSTSSVSRFHSRSGADFHPHRPTHRPNYDHPRHFSMRGGRSFPPGHRPMPHRDNYDVREHHEYHMRHVNRDLIRDEREKVERERKDLEKERQARKRLEQERLAIANEKKQLLAKLRREKDEVRRLSRVDRKYEGSSSRPLKRSYDVDEMRNKHQAFADDLNESRRYSSIQRRNFDDYENRNEIYNDDQHRDIVKDFRARDSTSNRTSSSFDSSNRHDNSYTTTGRYEQRPAPKMLYPSTTEDRRFVGERGVRHRNAVDTHDERKVISRDRARRDASSPSTGAGSFRRSGGPLITRSGVDDTEDWHSTDKTRSRGSESRDDIRRQNIIEYIPRRENLIRRRDPATTRTNSRSMVAATSSGKPIPTQPNRSNDNAIESNEDWNNWSSHHQSTRNDNDWYLSSSSAVSRSHTSSVSTSGYTSSTTQQMPISSTSINGRAPIQRHIPEIDSRFNSYKTMHRY